MIYKTLQNLIGTDCDVDWQLGRSRRFLLQKDEVGYTLTDTIVYPGSEISLEYKNHIETCYCVEGNGEVESDGKIYELYPGALYSLNKNDRHILRAFSQLRLICIFTPALSGFETHKFNKGEPSSY